MQMVNGQDGKTFAIPPLIRKWPGADGEFARYSLAPLPYSMDALVSGGSAALSTSALWKVLPVAVIML